MPPLSIINYPFALRSQDKLHVIIVAGNDIGTVPPQGTMSLLQYSINEGSLEFTQTEDEAVVTGVTTGIATVAIRSELPSAR